MIVCNVLIKRNKKKNVTFASYLIMACRNPRHSGLMFLLIAFWFMFAVEHGRSWHHNASFFNKHTFDNDTAKTEARSFASCPWKHTRIIINLARGKGYFSS